MSDLIRRFNRFELKYIFPVKKAEMIIEDLKTQMLPDEHGGLTGYKIVNLYYDSPELDFFWDKIEGIKYRRKVRIRIYPGENIEDSKEALAEIKQRVNQTVQKRRLKLDIKSAYKLCLGDFDYSNLDSMDRLVASEISYIAKAKNIKPTCITAYHRKAFVGSEYDAGLRITFDTSLKYRTKDLKINSCSKNKYFLPADYCIMEVKANEAVPDWVTSVLAKHNCRITRISKYCTGIVIDKKLPVMDLAAAPYFVNGDQNLE